MMKTLCRAVLALSLAAAGAGAGSAAWAGGPPFPVPARPGLHRYTYQVAEIVNGKLQHAYRTGFDLETTAAGATDVIVRTAEESADGKAWTTVPVSDACKAAMRAPPDGIARARLWPLDEAAAKRLGSSFLDECAPGGVFFPLTDILNVVIIPLSPRFRVSALRHKGDTAHYEGFTSTFNRAGEDFSETSHGGDVSLPSLADGKAVIDWNSADADLVIDETSNAQPIRLSGTEHWAFRLTLDARTGALIEAHTPYDSLDLKAHAAGMPEGASAPVKITRTVSITPR